MHVGAQQLRAQQVAQAQLLQVRFCHKPAAAQTRKVAAQNADRESTALHMRFSYQSLAICWAAQGAHRQLDPPCPVPVPSVALEIASLVIRSQPGTASLLQPQNEAF